MGEDDEFYKPILKVPQYEFKLKRTARKMLALAWGTATIPLTAMYFDYMLTGGIALFCIYGVYERALQNPMFSKLVYEIYVNQKNPDLIKFRTFNGYTLGKVSDIEPMMNAQEAHFNLNLHGRSQKGPSIADEAKALPASPDPDEFYMVLMKREVVDIWKAYVISDKNSKLPMTKDNRHFAFLIREKESLDPYIVGFTWGLTGLVLDREQLMMVISGNTWKKEKYFVSVSSPSADKALSGSTERLKRSKQIDGKDSKIEAGNKSKVISASRSEPSKK